jgi:hypothetical protein
MKSLIVLLLFIPLATFTPSTKGCNCSPAQGDTTRWGGNEWIAYKQARTYQVINGKVVGAVGGQGMDDVLVEIFDKPEYLLCEWKDYNSNKCTTDPPAEQRRVAACATGKDGKFCFSNIPAGRYELRVSKDGSWNVVRAYVIVDPSGRYSRRGGIVIEMTVGT